MIRNIVFNWLDVVVSTVVVFVLFPRLSSTLGADQYGVWLLLNAAVGYFGLLMLGVPLSTVRYITKYQAEQNPEQVRAVVNTAMLVYSGMSLLVLIAGGVLAAAIQHLVTIPQDLVQVTRWAIVILTVNCAATFPFFVLESILHAYQRFMVLGGIKVCATLLRFALTLALVRRTNGLAALAALVALASVVQFGLYFLYIKARIPGFEFKPWKADKGSLKAITGYSAAVLIFALASRVSFGTDSIVIAKMISAPAVVAYAVGGNFFIYLTTLMTGVSQVLMPRVSLLYSVTRKPEDLASLLVKYSEVAAYLSILACGGLYFFGADFIRVWMGQEYVERSFPVTVVLLVSYLPFLIQRAAAYPILMGTSRMSVVAGITSATAVVNLGASIWLARVMGIEGVAWGTTIPTLVSVIVIGAYLVRFVGLSAGDYLKRAFVRPLATVPVLAVAALMLKHLLGSGSLAHILIEAIVVTVVYAGSALLMFTDGKPREGLRSLSVG